MSDFKRFQNYYEEYMSQVYGYVYMRVGRDRQLAEDLVSEAFMKALEHFDTFSEKDGSFRAWIFKITKNHLIDYYRSSKSKSVESLEDLGNVLQDKADIEEDAKSGIEKEKLYEALKSLPEEKRELVVMKYLTGYSYKEIAEILGEDENKIRVKTFRTIKELKIKLFELKY